MKRFFWATTLLVCGFVLAFVFLGWSIPVRGGPGLQPSGNGDTNGDGQIDISDAIYLLFHLFEGGDPPVAIGDSPELLDRVSKIEGQLEGLRSVPEILTGLQF